MLRPLISGVQVQTNQSAKALVSWYHSIAHEIAVRTK